MLDELFFGMGRYGNSVPVQNIRLIYKTISKKEGIQNSTIENTMNNSLSKKSEKASEK